MGRQHLSDLQLAIMREVWTRGDASVNGIHEALRAERAIAPATVATVLNRLATDGVVTRERIGREYRYRALVSQNEMRRSMLGGLIQRLFGGDPATLVAHLVKEGDFQDTDLERVRAHVEAAQMEGN